MLSIGCWSTAAKPSYSISKILIEFPVVLPSQGPPIRIEYSDPLDLPVSAPQTSNLTYFAVFNRIAGMRQT